VEQVNLWYNNAEEDSPTLLSSGCINLSIRKWSMKHEKFLNEPNLLINPTTVRVPVPIGHCESINAEFMGEMTAAKALDILADFQQFPGIVLIDGMTFDSAAITVRQDSLERQYPVTRDLSRSECKDSVLVGRVRDDTTSKNATNLCCVSDNLRKGAATNAVQIAEEMLK
jgi:aspartate-semialdehyde dehydrogenase